MYSFFFLPQKDYFTKTCIIKEKPHKNPNKCQTKNKQTKTPPRSPSSWPRSHCRGKKAQAFVPVNQETQILSEHNMKKHRCRKARACSLSRVNTISAIITVNSKMQEYRTGYHASLFCKIHFPREMENTLKAKKHIFYQTI